MRRTFAPALAALLALAAAPRLAAHCQVPCGIYDDAARVQAMLEDVATIDKAVTVIAELAPPKDAVALNQATRWVSTKEDHASRIIATVSEYFLTQKLAEPAAGNEKALADYHSALAEHHAVLRAAMKAKQTVDPAAVAALRAAVETLGRRWSPPAK
jgi:nickel superoxide dismutase